jgi:hypothetical protein
MSFVKRARLLGILAALVSVLALAWPVNAQTVTSHYVARLDDPSNPGVFALVAAVVDPDGWAVVSAASNNDTWNAQHARWFRGRVIDGSFTGMAQDGTVLTMRRQGNQIQGTVGGQQVSATPLTGGAAAVSVGGNSEDIVLIIQAPDGTRVGRVWSRPTGQHKRTLLIEPARSGSSDSLRLMSSEAGQLGTPTTIRTLPNGMQEVNTGEITYTTSWCSSSFC